MVSGVRFFAAVAVGLGLVAGLGCHSDATYKLSWSFTGGEPASGLTCARHGVFSIFVQGSSEGGDSDRIETPCGPGVLTEGIPSGNWSFTVTGLDAAGRQRGDLLSAAGAPFLSAMVGPQLFDKGMTTEIAVALTPLPACADGVDNDCDGRIDLDDPSCKDDPRGLSEGDQANCNQQHDGGNDD